MAECFETVVYPVVLKYARKVLKDEDLQAKSLVLAWWFWRNRKTDFPPTVWARCGVRAARAGRDLPGVTSTRDLWCHWTRWSGAGMQNVMDKRPGPDKVAQDRELLEQFMRDLSDRDRQLVAAFLDGLPAQEVARRLDRSPSRVTNLRQELHRKWSDL